MNSFIIILNVYWLSRRRQSSLTVFVIGGAYLVENNLSRSPEVPLYPWYEHSPSRNHVQPVVKYVIFQFPITRNDSLCLLSFSRLTWSSWPRVAHFSAPRSLRYLAQKTFYNYGNLTWSFPEFASKRFNDSMGKAINLICTIINFFLKDSNIKTFFFRLYPYMIY